MSVAKSKRREPIERRIKWLESRISSYPDDKDLSFDKRELSALRWVLEELESSSKYITQTKLTLLNRLLKQGFGGGNWKELIEKEKERLQASSEELLK